VFVSGTLGEDNAVEMLKRGATDYVLKDRPARLAAAIRRALQEAAQARSQRAAEDELRRSRERFELLARATNDAIWDWDIAAGKVWWNAAVSELFGYERSAVGDSFEWWSERLHPEDQARVLAEFQAVLAGPGQYWSGEYRLRRADGSYATVIDRAFVLRDGAGVAQRALGSLIDVSEKRRLQEQFLRTQRMESIGTLAGGIAHDLNNMLSPILMAAQMLKTRLADERGLRLVQAIETTAQRGADVVQQILAFARGAEMEQVPLQPKHVMRELERMIRQTFPRSLEIRVELQPELWSVLANATQLHQVLLNLCVNARDAMPDGGVLTLSAENALLDAAFAAMHEGARPGPHVVLSVSDTGTGIPEALRGRIFEPFFTTKDAAKGTGLGLPTCATIAKSHGGFISVSSEVRKGTSFKLYLPALAGDVPRTAAEERSDVVSGSGETVLVVDDEAVLREITRETLETNGYKVVTAADGAEAVAAYAKARGQIQAVITDMAMPIMDGAATIHALRRIDPAVRILATSGMAQGGQETADAPQAFLQKPFTAESLLRALRELLSAQELSA
jgi:PAS domain S-box-containing protein